MSISETTILRAPCPSCGAILKIPADYPARVASCPLCGASVAVPSAVLPPLLEIKGPADTGSGHGLGLGRARSRRANKAEVWALCGAMIAISAALIAYAIQVATAPTIVANSGTSQGNAHPSVAEAIDRPIPIPLWVGDDAILDGRGKDKLYLAADGAWDDLLAADSAGIAHMVARGRVLCEENGSRVKLVSEKNGRWKVKVESGVNPGGEGWVRADDLRVPGRITPGLARSTSKTAPRVFTINESETPAKAAVDPISAFDSGAGFDNPSGRSGVSGFDNPVSARRPNSRAPRASAPNLPDPSFETPGTAPTPPATTTPDPNALPPRTPPGGTPR